MSKIAYGIEIGGEIYEFTASSGVTSGVVQTMIDESISGKADVSEVEAISAEVQTLSGEVQTISGESVTTGEVQTMIDSAISGKADSNNVYSKSESDNKYQLKGDYITSTQLSAFTYDKQTIDDKIAQGGTFDPTQYYNKTATDALLDLKADTANTYTKSEVNGLVVDKADTSALTQVNNALTAHTSDANVHVTASEKSTWNNKSDFSGNYNDLTNKPTIPNYTAGSGITITNNVISAKIWSGTKAQYDAITTKDADTIYLIYNS